MSESSITAQIMRGVEHVRYHLLRLRAHIVRRRRQLGYDPYAEWIDHGGEG